MSQKKDNPRMLTLEEWENLDEIAYDMDKFNEHHGTNYPVNWSLILSDEWLNMDENTAEIRFNFYKKWYIRNFTKLGQALR